MSNPMHTLIECLRTHGCACSAVGVESGPAVVRYEVRPDPDVRVERIPRLARTIAVAMAAHSVRIVAPIPGKGTVGIEVAAPAASVVSLADVHQAIAKETLPLPLGVDVAGRPFVADLAALPHLLIAGATGSGKSVCLNGIILSLASYLTPKELRLILIDPKVVELSAFASLPHLLCPVVTKGAKVPAVLNWLCSEMKRRYVLLQALQARNVTAFNAKCRSEEKMPHIVLVIDELAELMLTIGNEIEDGISRLAGLARAAGIHLIVATQRPSVDVITGVIKANLPGRIAFRVASGVDSRTILDTRGAETLLGKGDMLFLQPGSPDPVRLQGAFVADLELEASIAGISGEQSFVDLDVTSEEAAPAVPHVSEPTPCGLIDPACEIMAEYGIARSDLFSRHLKVSMETARQVIDLLTDRGIIGGGSPDAPRQLLVNL